MSITDDVASVTRQKKDDRSIARHREVSRDSATSGNNGPINATAATAATAMGGRGRVVLPACRERACRWTQSTKIRVMRPRLRAREYGYVGRSGWGEAAASGLQNVIGTMSSIINR